MNKSLLLSLTFVLMHAISTAQVAKVDLYPQQVEISHNDAVRQFSQFFVSSFNTLGGLSANQISGNANSALETNLAIEGNNNSTSASQTGLYNYATVGIIGDFNQLNLMQDGTNNTALLGLRGDNNAFNLSQIGDNNFYVGAYRTSNASINAAQIGNNLRAVEIGIGRIPIVIRQEGNGASLIINHHN